MGQTRIVTQESVISHILLKITNPIENYHVRDGLKWFSNDSSVHVGKLTVVSVNLT